MPCQPSWKGPSWAMIGSKANVSVIDLYASDCGALGHLEPTMADSPGTPFSTGSIWTTIKQLRR
jgi:hypothetical protein